MKYSFFLLSFFFFAVAHAQQTVNVKGIVKTSEGKVLSKASLLLYYKGSKDSLKTMSAENGEFSFQNVKAKHVGLIVSFIGYNVFTDSYDFTNATGEQTINNILMTPGVNTLENVTLESSKIQIKEDTVSYQIDSTMYRKNDNVESVLKKLPGVEVDRNGTVTAQGKEVTKVKVNGKEFFGGDVRTATRELNADMVDKIQIIDDYGDQSAFTGVKEGDPSKTLNIQLKKDKNKGYFGNVTAGGGTDERYITSVSLNKFNNDQQISLLGNLNNINASTFNFGALGGNAMGNMFVGMMKSMGIGQGGGGVGATLGNFGINDGVGVTKSIGLNYRDEWGSKISAYGSYSFNEKAINTLKNTTQQNTFQNRTNTNTTNSNDYTVTDNHRFSFNIEYKIDSFNYIKFNPSITYRKTKSEYNATNTFFNENNRLLSDGSIHELADSKVPGFNGTLLFNHRFHKKGRTMSVNLNAGKSSTEGTDDFLNANTYYPGGNPFDSINHQYIPQDNNNKNYGVRISYIEPLTKKRSLEFNYAYNYQYTGNDREVYLVDQATNAKLFSDSLSNVYDNVYTTNRIGVNYRATEKKYNYTIGMAVQPATIQSNSVTGKYEYTQHIVNYYPVVRFAYNFSRSRSFNLNYNGLTNQPGYTQLQPVADRTNSQMVTIGNPNLKPEFTNTFSTRYNNFDFISGNVFFGNISVSFTKDKIVTNTRPLGFLGGQETTYLNADGFYTITAFYNVSRPKQNRKYVFGWGGNIIYNNNVSYIESQKNTGKNWVFGQRLSFDFKVKKWLETSAAVNYSLNSTKYSLQSASVRDLKTNTWGLSHSARIYFNEFLILSYDIDKSINSGYSDNVSANPAIINATLEKQLLKKKNLSVKLQVLDILNENKGISRSVTASSITDTRTNRLARYFMLTFVWRLNKFAGDQS